MLSLIDNITILLCHNFIQFTAISLFVLYEVVFYKNNVILESVSSKGAF
jgi:hypothetical protein